METEKLFEDFIDTVTKLYDLETLAPLMEFCQGEMRTLYVLYKSQHREMTPSVISENLNVTRGRTTATLSSLRNKGYIDMEISSKDRRRMTVTLTDTGKKYYEKRKKIAEEYVRSFIVKIGEKPTVELLSLLKQALL